MPWLVVKLEIIVMHRSMVQNIEIGKRWHHRLVINLPIKLQRRMLCLNLLNNNFIVYVMMSTVSWQI